MLATWNACRAHRHGSESPYPGSTPGLNPCNHLAWLACGPWRTHKHNTYDHVTWLASEESERGHLPPRAVGSHIHSQCLELDTRKTRHDPCSRGPPRDRSPNDPQQSRPRRPNPIRPRSQGSLRHPAPAHDRTGTETHSTSPSRLTLTLHVPQSWQVRHAHLRPPRPI